MVPDGNGGCDVKICAYSQEVCMEVRMNSYTGRYHHMKRTETRLYSYELLRLISSQLHEFQVVNAIQTAN